MDFIYLENAEKSLIGLADFIDNINLKGYFRNNFGFSVVLFGNRLKSIATKLDRLPMKNRDKLYGTFRAIPAQNLYLYCASYFENVTRLLS